jgi:2-amino-4-hydroxy-6-hydroxymethyldihydropteridine diphosphokinase
VTRPVPASALVLGVGGNLGSDDDIVARFQRVVDAFDGWGRVWTSSVYRTAPWGGRAQAPFLNAALVVAVDVDPEPAELMAAVHEVEALLGRDRGAEDRWGPRTLDVDVLLWGPRIVAWPGPPRLEVPHPRFIERRFALTPVIDVLGGDVVVPGDGRTLAAIEASLPDQGVELTALRLVATDQAPG